MLRRLMVIQERKFVIISLTFDDHVFESVSIPSDIACKPVNKIPAQSRYAHQWSETVNPQQMLPYLVWPSAGISTWMSGKSWFGCCAAIIAGGLESSFTLFSGCIMLFGSATGRVLEKPLLAVAELSNGVRGAVPEGPLGPASNLCFLSI